MDDSKEASSILKRWKKVFIYPVIDRWRRRIFPGTIMGEIKFFHSLTLIIYCKLFCYPYGKYSRIFLFRDDIWWEGYHPPFVDFFFIIFLTTFSSLIVLDADLWFLLLMFSWESSFMIFMSNGLKVVPIPFKRNVSRRFQVLWNFSNFSSFLIMVWTPIRNKC